MTDAAEKKPATVKVVLIVPTNRANRRDVLEVDKKTADRLVANNQARRV